MRIIFISILISILPIAHSTAAPSVIADIAPVHGLVARVMMGIGTPVLLAEPGASAHDFSLSPSSTKALAQAAAVFWVGEPLTPWLKRPIENVAKNAKSVELLSLSQKSFCYLPALLTSMPIPISTATPLKISMLTRG